MNEEFVKKLYDMLVKEHIDIYRTLFEKTKLSDAKVEYWKNALTFYEKIDDSQKEIFYSILQQVVIDTISTTFGVIDGSSTLTGGNLEITMQIDGKDTDAELQDAFLLHVENQQQ